LFPHIHGAVSLLDAPAEDGVERRRAERLAGTEAEAGMMPRAANRLVDEQPLLKRRPVMSTDGADREQVIASPGEKRRLPMRMPEQYSAIGDAGERDSFDEVGSAECLVCVVHPISLTLAHERASPEQV
jgi:hypothetical protein